MIIDIFIIVYVKSIAPCIIPFTSYLSSMFSACIWSFTVHILLLIDLLFLFLPIALCRPDFKFFLLAINMPQNCLIPVFVLVPSDFSSNLHVTSRYRLSSSWWRGDGFLPEMHVGSHNSPGRIPPLGGERAVEGEGKDKDFSPKSWPGTRVLKAQQDVVKGVSFCPPHKGHKRWQGCMIIWKQTFLS